MRFLFILVDDPARLAWRRHCARCRLAGRPAHCVKSYWRVLPPHGSGPLYSSVNAFRGPDLGDLDSEGVRPFRTQPERKTKE